ncbi:hypothetical protein ATJ93_2683 [Halopiger aswanensis]|uniref:Uncharacterized protein n=1 Tax=Halopiger aswanensis TaxID=148449 RepID=A0A3R7HYG9_9EURY|nr:hypothetical protein ATJ93_2683 [Halopiger aswanensis]
MKSSELVIDHCQNRGQQLYYNDRRSTPPIRVATMSSDPTQLRRPRAPRGMSRGGTRGTAAPVFRGTLRCTRIRTRIRTRARIRFRLHGRHRSYPVSHTPNPITKAVSASVPGRSPCPTGVGRGEPEPTPTARSSDSDRCYPIGARSSQWGETALPPVSIPASVTGTTGRSRRRRRRGERDRVTDGGPSLVE